MRSIAGLVVYLFTCGAQAAIVTIDFEEFTPDVAVNPPSGDATSKGYTLDYFDQGAGNPVVFSTGLNGTQTYGNCPDCQSPEIIDIYETLGGTLTLLSLDIGSSSSAGNHEFRFVGTKSSGGTINKIVDSLNGAMQTVTFDGSWNNLDSFRIEISPNFQSGAAFSASEIDNIVINSVPIPSAVWLFGSALAGLGWLKRKRLN